MKNLLNKVANCNCIPALLVFAALAILLIQMIGIIANVASMISAQPGRAVIVFTAATVSALIQPCILLGIARIVTIMQNRTPNA